jgi:hypothetical protein
MQWPKEIWEKDEQWSTKHLREYWRSSNMNFVIMPVEIQNKKSLNYYQNLQYNGQKKLDGNTDNSSQHYKENYSLSNTNPT